MPDTSAQDIASKLLSDGFTRTGPVANTLSDPVADTPMIVTLNELMPYELDPRLTRNPLYDEIKASIYERGLDAPPPITRRSGANHYIIRNGGNTRLAILRELWSETRDERFFRILCLFRPWPERGEIVALTGHLAENELHGGLSFIERALGVQKARELYEIETGKTLSQSELARRLKADGYPVPQPHISRMQEAIQYLLPAIPTVLYAGLGRHQVEQLTSLRRAAEKIWLARAAKISSQIDFPTLFQDVLALFDSMGGGFSVQRVQDELIGQMSDILGVEYDTLAFDITDTDRRWQVLTEPPAPAPEAPTVTSAPRSLSTSPTPEATQAAIPSTADASAQSTGTAAPTSPSGTSAPAGEATQEEHQDEDGQRATLLQKHIVSPAGTTERLQSIQRLVADHTGEMLPDFESNVRSYRYRVYDDQPQPSALGFAIDPQPFDGKVIAVTDEAIVVKLKPSEFAVLDPSLVVNVPDEGAKVHVKPYARRRFDGLRADTPEERTEISPDGVPFTIKSYVLGSAPAKLPIPNPQCLELGQLIEQLEEMPAPDGFRRITHMLVDAGARDFTWVDPTPSNIIETPPAISFTVSTTKFEGRVTILFERASDTYAVELHRDSERVERIEEVYFDMLGEVLERLIDDGRWRLIDVSVTDTKAARRSQSVPA